MTRKLKPETMLANFARYLYGQYGLSETPVEDHITTIKRLFDGFGYYPTARKANDIIATMRKNGKSTSHQVNTAIALERYGKFRHVTIKLGRP